MKDQDDMAADPRDAYFSQARSWAEDREAIRARSVRIAWTTASVAAAIALVEALALLGLTPLKTVVPYTLLVDRTTGYVQALEGTQLPLIKQQSALTQSLLAQYVLARESFDINTIADQYRKVALWSAETARSDYLAQMQANNPQSPVRQFPRSTMVATRVESISPLSPQTALVRFVTERRDQGQGASRADHWVVVIRFRFSGEPMAIAERLVNPLGFQVVSYRRDQESAPLNDSNMPAPTTVAPVVMEQRGVAPPSGNMLPSGLPLQGRSIPETGAASTMERTSQQAPQPISSVRSSPLTAPGPSALPFESRRPSVGPDRAGRPTW